MQPNELVGKMRSRHDRILDLAERRLSLGVERGLIQRRIEDEVLEGAMITLDGAKLVNFGSCAYLGLNRDPRLKAGAIDAAIRFGTSYSSSPTYTALGMYDTLESQLRRITGGAVAIAQTTTLAHIAALPILVGPEDLALVDARTHDSMQLAATVLKGNGVTVETVPHNDMSALREVLARRSASYHRVWYLADGIYSMFGDVAPVKEIVALLDSYSNLHAYFDDAHGFGWQGLHGCGYVLSETPLHERMVMAAGLSKSFGTLGAVLAFGDPEAARRVRLTGGPLTFSGPVPPPALGAAVVSANIHLSDEHAELRARLISDIDMVRGEIIARQLPVLSLATTPIWYIRVGGPESVAEMVRRLMKDGFYVNAAAYPAVPVGYGGVRFTQTLHNTPEQARGLLVAIEHHLPQVTSEPDFVVDLRDDADVLAAGTEPDTS
jgi:7-keto-8-aminopelargonate synthetase-like enzyme